MWLIGKGIAAVINNVHGIRAAARFKKLKCPHGFTSNGQLCATCIAGRERVERLRIIKNQASSLASSELARLSAAWSKKGESFFEMSWQQFEDGIAGCFEQLGYAVQPTRRSSDGGYDGAVTKDNRKYLYECKSGKQNIGRPEIQKFHSAMVTEKAHGGFFINSGTFSDEAWQYGKKIGLRMVDHKSLAGFVASAYPLNGERLSISLMCEQCGETVKVASLPVAIRCSVGHQIFNTVTFETIVKHAAKTARRSPYYRNISRRGRRENYRPYPPTGART